MKSSSTADDFISSIKGDKRSCGSEFSISSESGSKVFDDQKLKKKIQLPIFIYLFFIKNSYPVVSIKDVQATGEALTREHQVRYFSTGKE
jgi:hypothetical protein